MAPEISSVTMASRLRSAVSRRVLTPVVLAAAVTTGWVFAVAPPVIEAHDPGGPPAARPAGPESSPEPPASVTRVAELPQDALTPAAPVVLGTAIDDQVGVPGALAEILLDAYRNAVAGAPEGCHLPVSLLAAIGEVESGSLVGRPLDEEHRTHVLGPVLDGDPFARVLDTDGGWLDGNPRWDRALGPMQILPGTWVRFATDGDHDGSLDPQDLEDAAATAASYLCDDGRDLARPAELRAAVLAYNHSRNYLRLVMTLMARYRAAGLDQALPGVVAAAALQLTATSVPIGASHLRGYVEADSGTASGGAAAVLVSAGPTPAEQVAAALGDPVASLAGTPTPSSDPTLETSPTSSPEAPSATPPPPTPTAGSPDPSPTPSVEPSPEPTSDPTVSPSGDPTVSPSGGPSTDPAPSATPSASPTCDVELGTGAAPVDQGACPPGASHTPAAKPWDERPGNRGPRHGHETTSAPSG